MNVDNVAHSTPGECLVEYIAYYLSQVLPSMYLLENH